MEEGCVQIVAMTESNSDSEEKYEIYEAGNDMYCVIDINNQNAGTRSTPNKGRYKQSYREAWESLKDFKGWLTSVPGNTSKAYCKLCQKELHCHRLSLLKHKVTFKHQKKEEEQKLLNLKESDINQGALSSKKAKIDAKIPAAVNEEIELQEEEEEEGIEMEDSNLQESLIVSNAESETCDETSQENEEIMSAEKGPLSTHVLDLTKGLPAASVHIVLYKLVDGRWTLINEGSTSADGRYDGFFSSPDVEFTNGRYKLHFDVDKYFVAQNQSTIYPFVEIVFDVQDESSHYHIPLLLSPYGYSTYRGS